MPRERIAWCPEPPSTVNTSISVPAAALPGNTRMRVSMRNGNVPTSCGNIMWGEVEDYTVTIRCRSRIRMSRGRA